MITIGGLTENDRAAWENLFTDTQARGVGRALIEAVAGWARAHGVPLDT
jgi:GNAT superfamily N-acetyltransferase